MQILCNSHSGTNTGTQCCCWAEIQQMPQNEANQLAVPTSAQQQQVQRSTCTLSSESPLSKFNFEFIWKCKKQKEIHKELAYLTHLERISDFFTSSPRRKGKLSIGLDHQPLLSMPSHSPAPCLSMLNVSAFVTIKSAATLKLGKIGHVASLRMMFSSTCYYKVCPKCICKISIS